MKSLKAVPVFFLVLALYGPAGAEDVRQSLLDMGLRNNDAYSYMLIQKAAKDTQNSERILTEAAEISPDTPAFRFELARNSMPDASKAVPHFVAGLKAYKSNFWWRTNLWGLGFLCIAGAVFMTLAAVSTAGLIKAMPLMAHEITERPVKMLIPLALVFLSAVHPLLFVAGALAVAGLYFEGAQKAIVYAGLIVIMLSPVYEKTYKTLFESSSPELRAVVAVNEGRDNNYALNVLREPKTHEAEFSYALALKRTGRFEEALVRYESAKGRVKTQTVEINKGNAYMGLQSLENANAAYEAALALGPSATAYYNSSKLLNDMFKFDEGKDMFQKASEADGRLVSEFAEITNRNPNRFVFDETLGQDDFKRLASEASSAKRGSGGFSTIIISVFSAILLLAFGALDSKLPLRATRCPRCGNPMCKRCAPKVKGPDLLCRECVSAYSKTGSDASGDKLASLITVQKKKSMEKLVARILSVFPGISHLYRGSYITGAIFVGSITFFLLIYIINPVISAGLGHEGHFWLVPPALILAGIIYLISLITALKGA